MFVKSSITCEWYTLYPWIEMFLSVSFVEGSFWSLNAHISYRIQALHSSIDQNMEQVELQIFHWD